MLIRLLGIDPSMSNTGYAVADYIIGAEKPIDIIKVGLIETEPGGNKKVRKSSDDLRRARDLHTGLMDVIQKYDIRIATAEIPSGAQSARASLSNGMCVGFLASLPIPIIEVSPTEVKLASAGTKTADKEDIVRWAVNMAPAAPGWPVSNRANDWEIACGDKWIVKKAEHPADACAAIAAAAKTEQFKQLIGMIQSLRAA